MQTVSCSSDQSATSPPHLGQTAMSSWPISIRTPTVYFPLGGNLFSFMGFPPSFLREALHPPDPPVLELFEISLPVRSGEFYQLFPLSDGIDKVIRIAAFPGAIPFVEKEPGTDYFSTGD